MRKSLPNPAARSQILDWLLDGDVSIQYQVHRDLLATERSDLRQRIATEGWGARFLGFRNAAGHWGQRFYQPKWISTHYTILDLKNLAIPTDNTLIRESLAQVVQDLKARDGGILPIGAEGKSDVCVNGMFLNYASYFRVNERDLRSIVDFLLGQILPDGGFNCESNRRPVKHSSLHSTISVLEGLHEFGACGHAYRSTECREAEARAREFLLRHRLFRSDRTGEVIDKKFLMLSYPSRWRYDILRALDHLRSAAVQFDPRLGDALGVLHRKRRRDGTWPVQAKHPGQTHFEMEKTGGPSRWNTLRAMRVLEHFHAVGK